MANMLELNNKCSVLDPACGHGILTKAIHKLFPKLWVHIQDINTNYSGYVFSSNEYTICLQDDNFLELVLPKYDRIICNPPFGDADDIWIDFIKKMYRLLNPNGILVTIAPTQPTEMIQKFDGFKNKMRELKAERVLIDNWYTNKDGSTTPICITKIRKYE